VDPRAIARPEGLCQLKKSNDTIGNRTRDLPACSAVPQPTAPLRAPMYIGMYVCMYACMHACVCVCMYVCSVCIHSTKISTTNSNPHTVRHKQSPLCHLPIRALTDNYTKFIFKKAVTLLRYFWTEVRMKNLNAFTFFSKCLHTAFRMSLLQEDENKTAAFFKTSQV
jgi:hypothetical protein